MPVPAGYHTVTPYLIVSDPAAAIEFYKKAFGATEFHRLNGPGGSIAHAELRIGDSPIMLAGEVPQFDARSPDTLGGSPVGFCLYVENSDAAFDRAIAAGGTVVRPVQDQFYGDRSGTLKDPFGHKWTIATRKEDLSLEEMQKRMEAMMARQAG